MLRLFIKILIFAFAYQSVTAQQHICGNEILWKDKVSKEKTKFTDDLLRKHLSNHGIRSRSLVTIPVVVHVLWFDSSEDISDAAIKEQIAILNQAFSRSNHDVTKVPEEFKSVTGSTKIRFCLASMTPENEPTNGIIRKRTTIPEIGLSDHLYESNAGGSNAWDSDKYLNIWVADTGKIIVGFGTYPNQTPPEKTGVVIHPKYFGRNNHPKFGLGRTLVHEVGHYFGLNHLWGDDSNCATDDDVEDTPPQLKAYRGCPNHPQSGCSPSEMFMNYMDYVDDQCMYFFTQGQADRMLATINLYRKGLIDSGIGCNENSSDFEKIKIYPNPSYGKFKVESITQITADIVITNQLGQTINPIITRENENLIFDISNFPQGMYFVNVGNKGFKIVKL